MNAFLVLLLALLLFGLSAFRSGGEGESQSCVASTDGIERCGPTTIDGGLYRLPDAGVVISARVNNGPLPPEYQAGYEISVDADGTVVTTVTEAGHADAPTTTEKEIGEEGVQALLQGFEQCGLYYLPQRDEFADTDLPVGGGVSILEVTLADGDWASSGVTLSGPDVATFDGCQTVLADELGIESPLD